jgi:hypothetical protein
VKLVPLVPPEPQGPLVLQVPQEQLARLGLQVLLALLDKMAILSKCL